MKPPTLNELIGKYTARYISNKSFQNKAWQLQHIEDYFGRNTPPEYIYRHNVEEFKEWLRVKRELAPRTIKEISNSAKALWNWMMDLELVDSNPFAPRSYDV